MKSAVKFRMQYKFIETIVHSSVTKLFAMFIHFAIIGLVLYPPVWATKCVPSPTSARGYGAPSGEICSGDLIFEDNFDKLNLNTWTHVINDGNGLKDFHSYVNSRENSYVEDGIFYIKATPRFPLNQTDRGDLKPVLSARMSTRKSFGFKYGKVEVRARLPAGDWLRPALWFIPYGPAVYGQWPLSGEIDLMESRGNRNLTKKVNGTTVNWGVERFGSTLHFGNRLNNSRWQTAHGEVGTKPGQGFNTAFRKYQMEWSPNGFNFSLDGQLHTEIKVGKGFFDRGGFGPNEWNPWTNGTLMAPFDEHFQIVLNVAVGGITSFSGCQNEGGKPWSDSSPKCLDQFWHNRMQWLKTWKLEENNGKEASFQIDYVRVWAI